MLSLTECVWESQNNALWDTHLLPDCINVILNREPTWKSNLNKYEVEN